MNKDKLISLIIRKETYKDTKSYLTDLLNLKQEAVKSSHQAIKEILTTDYNAQAKLYAIRYLKDAFEKANPSFIALIEKDILPILINISIDENDQKSHIKYAGSSYTKTEELSKFKAIVSSLFRMVKECIIKWAEWIPDPNRKFVQALNEIKKKKVSLDFQWKYFRPENQQIFKQCCQKNGIKLFSSAEPKPSSASKPQIKPSKDPLVYNIEKSLQNVKAATNQKELLKIENDFNEAINNYLENADDFKQEFVQESFDQFEKLKNEAKNRIKGPPQKIKESAAPTPTGNPLPKENSTKKIQSSGLKSNESNKKSEKEKIQKIEPPSPPVIIQQKIEKKISNNSKKEIQNVRQQKIKNEIISPRAVNSNNVLKSQRESQKEIKQSKKIQQPVKTVKEQLKIQIPATNKQSSVKSPRTIQQKKQKIVVEQEIKKIDAKPIISPNASKQAKIPTSPKRGPIKFDEQESPFSSQKPSLTLKEESKNPLSKQPSVIKKQNKFDISASKQESERINFSDEDSSEFSEDANHRIEPRDFKKKSQLTPIKQETSRGPHEEQQSANKNMVLPKSSRIVEEESLITREKKGGVTHKLMEQNKNLMERYEKLMQDFQRQMREKVIILKEKQSLQKQIKQKLENEQKLIKKLKASVPIEDYHRLRKELQQQRLKRQGLIKQNIKMRNANESLIEELNQTKYKLKNYNNQNDKSRQRVSQSQSNTLNVNVNQTVSKPVAVIPIVKQQIDEDYIKNLTHTSNLHNLLSKVNLSLFKRNALSQSQIFYRDQYVSIMAKSRVYTQNNEQFVSMNITFQFKSLKQVKPQVRYKNCQQLDLWSKPLTGQQQLYTQQLAIRLHSNPLKVIKAELKVIQAIDIMFFLPILYLNFLREEQFANEEFDDIFLIKSQQLLKSKITQWNSQVIKQIADMHKLFKYSIIIGDKVRFCLSQGINDQIFMAQFEILRNNKFLLRILPIPYTQEMVSKTKQLMQNIIFLLS